MLISIRKNIMKRLLHLLIFLMLFSNLSVEYAKYLRLDLPTLLICSWAIQGLVSFGGCFYHLKINCSWIIKSKSGEKKSAKFPKNRNLRGETEHSRTEIKLLIKDSPSFQKFEMIIRRKYHVLSVRASVVNAIRGHLASAHISRKIQP